MTLAEHDARCNDLARKLESLRAAGHAGTFRPFGTPDGRGEYIGVTPGYMETLYALKDATGARLKSIGLGVKAL